MAEHSGRRVRKRFDSMWEPHALVGSRWDLPAAVACVVALGTVFAIEAATPDDVVGVFALLPLMAAMWLLSTRSAILVGAVAGVLFAVAVAWEVNNRPTEIFTGAAALAIVLATRWYGDHLGVLIAASRQRRVAIQPMPVSPVAEWKDRIACTPEVQFLTRRELEVARLASWGHTAREIGVLLHISERTVENHLANAYGKLGINSRPALIKMSAQLSGR